MATVRITDELIGKVSVKIDDMKRVEYRETFGTQSYSDTILCVSEIPEGFDEVRFQDHAQIAKQLPEDWFETSREFVVKYVPTPEERHVIDCVCPERLLSDITPEGHVNAVQLTIVLPDPVTHSPLAATDWRTKRYARYIPTGSLLTYAESLRKLEKVRNFEARWKSVVQEVRAFLRSQNSLNGALKALPAIRMYIPVQYLERVETPNQRRGQSKAIEQFDTDLIASTAVRVRMASSI